MAAMWTCDLCQRQFGRKGQSHECAPAMTLDEYFAAADDPELAPRVRESAARERPIFEAVMAHLESIADEPIHVDPVSVGIFIKRSGSFLELRPRTKWVALSFSLSREIKHSRIARKVVPYSGRYFHVVNLTGPDDVDDVVKEWLTEAFFDRPRSLRSRVGK